MLNCIVLNGTDYLNKNGFGVKLTYKGWYVIKPNKPNLINKHLRNNNTKHVNFNVQLLQYSNLYP